MTGLPSGAGNQPCADLMKPLGLGIRARQTVNAAALGHGVSADGIVRQVYPSSFMLLAPNLRHQGLAASRASLTFLMFSTPVVSSQSRKALAPCLAKTAMPSFHVTRPQRTPLNLVPDSPASSRVSMKTGLETPAERYMKGLWVIDSASRKC